MSYILRDIKKNILKNGGLFVGIHSIHSWNGLVLRTLFSELHFLGAGPGRGGAGRGGACSGRACFPLPAAIFPHRRDVNTSKQGYPLESHVAEMSVKCVVGKFVRAGECKST